jgi:ADP-heptose:LPS heptosyltransferase
MLRFFSLIIRKLQAAKKQKEVLRTFAKWQSEASSLPHSTPSKKLLLIRLDDIGDYIVFRNFLDAYKLSEKWKDYEITLLGNIAWKELFENFDKTKVDKTIWIDKGEYFNNEDYRKQTWDYLRNQSFDVIINPSRTRPLLLDDVCAVASAAPKRIGCANTFKYHEWNKVSDNLYNELFSLENSYVHEFVFNREFAQWCCGVNVNVPAPSFEGIQQKEDGYFVFFIGAASKSRRWPTKRWIELIQLINKHHPNTIFVTGGTADMHAAEEISSVTNVENITGKKSLTETIQLIAGAKCVVSNNTMAAHAAIACSKPVIIIANGDNYFRFTEYQALHLKNITTIYTDIFLKNLKGKVSRLIHWDAVTVDISTIKATAVFNEMNKMLS